MVIKKLLHDSQENSVLLQVILSTVSKPAYSAGAQQFFKHPVYSCGNVDVPYGIYTTINANDFKESKFCFV